MTHEEPEFLTDICDFTTLFYMVLRCRSSEWLEKSISRGTWPMFSRERFTTVTSDRGFAAKTQVSRDAVYTELIN